MCKHNRYHLEDRKGFDMPLMNDSMCTMKILNTRRLSLLRYIDDLQSYGINNIRLEFTVEDDREVEIVASAYKRWFDGNKVLVNLNDVTMGYYNE